MAAPYLEELKTIVQRLSLQSGDVSDLTCKHFFSGAAAYLDGRIFMTLTPVGLALKLSAADRDMIFAQGAKPLKYFPKAPVKKEYALLPSRLVEDENVLGNWISRSLAYMGGRQA